MAKTKREIAVEALRHRDKRRNIPTAELEPVMEEREKTPIRIAYERRNRDLDPQLVWRGKDEEDWSGLVVQAPPLYIQEKIHPKVLVDDLLRQSRARRAETAARAIATPICSPISTACPTGRRRPSSTGTTPTGRTA